MSTLQSFDRPNVIYGDVFVTPHETAPAEYGSGDIQIGGQINTDSMAEITLNTGVTIEELEFQDNAISGATAGGGTPTTYLSDYYATYTTATDVNYNSSSWQDIPNLSLTLPAGTYLVGYSFTMHVEGDSLYPVAIAVRDSSGNNVADSRTWYKRWYSNHDTYVIAKCFKMVTATENTYKVSFIKANGSTSVAVPMSLSTTHTDPDQHPSFWAILDDASRLSYAKFDNQYAIGPTKNGTNWVDVDYIQSLELTLDPGTYLMSYNFAPYIEDPVMNFGVHDGSNNFIAESQDITYISAERTPMILPVSKMFVYTVSTQTTYKVAVREESGSNTTQIFLLSGVSGAPSPCQVLNFLAFELSGLTMNHINYSGSTTVNYAGTTPIDFPSFQLTLDAGKYLMGYSMQFHGWASLGNMYIRTASDNTVIEDSRAMMQLQAGQTNNVITKVFELDVASTTTYKVSANLDTTAVVAATDNTFDNPVFFALLLSNVQPAENNGVLIENIRFSGDHIVFEGSEDAPTNNANQSLIFRSSGNTYGNAGDLYLETHDGTSNAVRCIAPYNRIVQSNLTTGTKAFSGTSYVDIASLVIDKGTWLITYCFTHEGVASSTSYFRVYESDAGNYIEQSRCATSLTRRKTLHHQFIYTNTVSSNTLTLRTRMDSGTSTKTFFSASLSVNISPDPDVVLCFFAVRID